MSEILIPENAILLPLKVGGHFTLEHIRNGEVIYRENPHNTVVNEGLNDLLNVYLKGGTQTANWYIALFAGNVTPSSSLTAATFTAATTEFTNYNESTRQAWVGGTVASQSVDNNASKANFTIGTGGGTVYGAALLSASAKSATTGVCFAATRFAAPRTLQIQDVLSIGYAVGASSA